MMPTDSMSLFSESREHPMHVGGLSLFQPPEGLETSLKHLEQAVGV